MKQRDGISLENVNEDRISDLPDALIQHILSFLPSTKEAIRTSLLSKRWRNQWTRVPVLIFDFYSMRAGQSYEPMFASINQTLALYDCSKIRKFQLCYNFELDPCIASKIQFATSRHVEELLLNFEGCVRDEYETPYLLPQFLYNNDSLTKLELHGCTFEDNCVINWGSLKTLVIYSFRHGQMVRNVLSGCPLLGSLELCCDGPTVIASESLKKLYVIYAYDDQDQLDISCPNLEELSFVVCSFPNPTTIEKVLSDSMSLCSLEIMAYKSQSDKLVIASKSLKKLVIDDIRGKSEIEIWCPNLEEMDLSGLDVQSITLMDLPSPIFVTLEFVSRSWNGCGEKVANQILEQLQHVDELKDGSRFLKLLSALGIGGPSYPLINSKCLTLGGPSFQNLLGLVCALRSLPSLERLITFKVAAS